MKRIISLSLVAVVLIFSLAVPSFAAESDTVGNDTWFNVMDFTELGQVYTHAGVNYVDIPLPTDKVYYGIDFIVDDNCGIKSIYVDLPYDYGCGMVDIGNGLKRFYCDASWTGDWLTLAVDVENTGYQWFQFLAFHVRFQDADHFTAPAVAEGFYPDGGSIQLSVNSDYFSSDHCYFKPSTFEDRQFCFDLWSPDWKMYDYMDFVIFLHVDHISMISAICGDVTLPFSVSYIERSSTQAYLVSVRVDLRGINRDTSELPHVTIGGMAEFNVYNAIILASCSGFVLLNDINPLFYYFKDLKNNLSSLFSNLSLNISNWGQSIVSSVDSVGSKIETWGQNIVDAIVGDQTANETVNDALHTQEEVNEQINVQLGSAVDDWDGNITIVSQGFNSAYQNSVPALQFLSNLAQSVWSGMGWFGNMFFFLGFLHVFFLLMSKSGLGKAVDKIRNGDD